MTPDELARALTSGDRRALAKAITLVESSKHEDRAAAQRLLLQLPRSNTTLRLGITGPPGVGKSTLIDKLGVFLLAAGRRPAVLAYDPSSRRGGSVMADKTRMQELTQQEAAFVRPSPNRGADGGVGRAALSAVRLCEAAGYDPVIVETVGVGQSELAIADLVDLLTLILLPNAGDELQGMKKGILEHADLVLLNKADGPYRAQAEAAAQDVRRALALFSSGRTSDGTAVEVKTISALEGWGVGDVWDYLERRFSSARTAGLVERRRQHQLALLFRRQLVDELERQVLHSAEIGRFQKDVEQRLFSGALQLEDAVDEVLAFALGSQEVGRR